MGPVVGPHFLHIFQYSVRVARIGQHPAPLCICTSVMRLPLVRTGPLSPDKASFDFKGFAMNEGICDLAMCLRGYPARLSSGKFQGLLPPSPAQGPAGRSGPGPPALQAVAGCPPCCRQGHIVVKSIVQMVRHQVTASSGVFPAAGSAAVNIAHMSINI